MKEAGMTSIANVPEVLDVEVRPRLQMVCQILDFVIQGGADPEDCINSAIDALVTARRRYTVSKAVAGQCQRPCR